MKDSATIDEAIDLVDCAGWKGYAQALRELKADKETLRAKFQQVQGLIQTWRDIGDDMHARGITMNVAYEDCADQLEAVLAEGRPASTATLDDGQA